MSICVFVKLNGCSVIVRILGFLKGSQPYYLVFSSTGFKVLCGVFSFILLRTRLGVSLRFRPAVIVILLIAGVISIDVSVSFL